MSVTVKGITYEVKTTYEGNTLVLQDADITSIKEIVGLDKLTDLNTLYLNKNQITKIEGLTSLKSCRFFLFCIHFYSLVRNTLN